MGCRYSQNILDTPIILVVLQQLVAEEELANRHEFKHQHECRVRLLLNCNDTCFDS